MFIGEYATALSEKNRVSIPKKLRLELKGKVYLTRGYENCLIMVDFERWDNLIKEINRRPLLSMDARDSKRFIVGGAYEIELDSQGRFVIPEPLKSFALIEMGITFLGVGEWIELWNEERWREKLSKLSETVTDIAERIH